MQEGYALLRPLTVEFQNGGLLRYELQPNWQRLSMLFNPLPGVDIAPGAYDYLRNNLTLQTDPSARLATRFEAGSGGYFDGSLYTARALIQATPDPRFAVSGDYTVNRLAGVGTTTRSLTTHLLGVETRVAANPRLQLVNFAEWNTAARQLSWNTRFAWEYRPLAFLNVVFNRSSPVSGLGVPAPTPAVSSQFLVKWTWLLQM